MKDKELVIEAIKNEQKHVVIGVAPAVRVSLGEEFGIAYGTNVEGKLISSLKSIGFNKVFDVNFTADLTIIEEGSEFLEKHQEGKKPLISSCCPASLRFIKKTFPEFVGNLSTTKSPQQMFGTVCKTYYADKYGINPNDIFVATLMPCIVKKTERVECNNDIVKPYDVDAVITTKELAELIRENNIDFNTLEEGNFDEPFNNGHSVIFGTSGGVTESMVRYLAEKLSNSEVNEAELKEVKNNTEVKELTYKVGEEIIKIAIVSGLPNVKSILEKVKNGEATYDFIEVMACPGGCANGAGQPMIKENREEVIKKRQDALYNRRDTKDIEKILENNVITDLYDNYFKNGKYSHEILHTNHEN